MTHVGRRAATSLVLAAACWGSSTVISKRALDAFDPLVLLPAQLTVSVLILTFVAAARAERITWTRDLRRLALLGVLNPGAAYALSLAGLVHVSASLSVLIWALEPLLILGLARWILRDRISLPMVLAVVAALAGVALVVVEPVNHGDLLGIGLTVAGVGVCAAYSVLTRKLLVNDAALVVVLVQQVSALVFAVVLLVAAAMLGTRSSLEGVTGEAWLSAGLSGALYYAAAFWFYLDGLRRVPASVAGMFINLIPVFGLAAAWALLGETLAPLQWAGAIIVVGSVSAIGIRRPTTIDAARAHLYRLLR